MGEFFVDLINFIIRGVGSLLAGLLELFPDTPFLAPSDVPAAVNLKYIAWLIPFPSMVAHTVLIASAVLTYYIIRVAARWVKLVRS